jgi:Na+-transporting NADH:ubiquinone oxidoreductase subunit NqrD
MKIVQNVFLNTTHLIVLGIIVAIVLGLTDLFTSIRDKYISSDTGTILANAIYLTSLFIVLFIVFYLYAGSLNPQKFSKVIEEGLTFG